MYTREITVMPSDASFNGQIKLRSFLDYLQDTASMAVEDVEGSTSQLMERGYAWILTRYEIEFTSSLPALDEKFIVNTFHDPNHGYGTLRVFQVNKLNGDLIAWAKTSWLLLDLAAGRPVKPIQHLPGIAERDTDIINPDFGEIPRLNENNIIQTPYSIRFHDLDINGHANNAAYFEWIFEASANINGIDLMKYNLKSASAFFRSGVKWGEKLRILISEINNNANNDNIDNINNKNINNSRSFVYHIVNDSREKSEKPTAFFCLWERETEK